MIALHRNPRGEGKKGKKKKGKKEKCGVCMYVSKQGRNCSCRVYDDTTVTYSSSSGTYVVVSSTVTFTAE